MHLNIRNEACIPNIIRKGRLDARSFFPRFSFVLSVGVSRKIMRQSIVIKHRGHIRCLILLQPSVYIRLGFRITDHSAPIDLIALSAGFDRSGADINASLTQEGGKNALGEGFFSQAFDDRAGAQVLN